jgi:hypothetical protein
LTQDVGPFKFGQTVQDFLFTDANLFAKFLEGLVDHGKGGLDQVEKLSVGYIHVCLWSLQG